jgi:hypothetical protein
VASGHTSASPTASAANGLTDRMALGDAGRSCGPWRNCARVAAPAASLARSRQLHTRRPSADATNDTAGAPRRDCSADTRHIPGRRHPYPGHGKAGHPESHRCGRGTSGPPDGHGCSHRHRHAACADRDRRATYSHSNSAQRRLTSITAWRLGARRAAAHSQARPGGAAASPCLGALGCPHGSGEAGDSGTIRGAREPAQRAVALRLRHAAHRCLP